MSRFLSRKRIILAVLAIPVVLVLGAAAALTVYLNSPAFEKRVHGLIIGQIEERTGGKASLTALQWDLWTQRFVLEDLTIRGLEPAEGPALAHIESITAGFKVRNLLQRRVDLSELTITRPTLFLTVDPKGRTNLPDPQGGASGQMDFQVAIDNFSVVGGQAAINERRFGIDFSVSGLVSELSYASATQILKMHVNYTGSLQHGRGSRIPYKFDGTLDYTRGTLVAHDIDLVSGRSAVSAQGRIDDVFTGNIRGRMEYSGDAEVAFLNHFLPRERLAGKTKVSGKLEFSRGYFFTNGSAAAASISFEDWNARDVRTEYSYNFPGRKLFLRNVKARVLDGTAAGSIVIDPLPGSDARFSVDLEYANIDSALLRHVYPWDPKYAVYSRLSGDAHGWFQNRFSRFEFAGLLNLTSYSPPASRGEVPLPLDGSAEYTIVPGQVEIRNGDGRLYSTLIRAEGLIHPAESRLTVDMTSTDLANLSFLYPEANGAGTFKGTVAGPIRTPTLKGSASIDGYKHHSWTIPHADGEATLDLVARNATLRDVKIQYGQSRATIKTGTASLDGSAVDLVIQVDQGHGEDIGALVEKRIGGQFTGSLHVRSLNPIRFDNGKINVAGLVFEGRPLGDVQAEVNYNDPVADIKILRATDRGATLNGDIAYNRASEAIGFDVNLTSLDLNRLRDLGVPDTLQGVLRQATLKGTGTTSRPEISGTGIVQNLAFHGETFPEVRLGLETAWPEMTVTLTNGSDLSLDAKINAAATGYPFNATAVFKNYSLEDVTAFGSGSLTATGNASFTGLLSESSGIKGKGTIEAAQIRVQDNLLQVSRPFTFAFDTSQLTLSRIELSERLGTKINVEGTIGLTRPARLGLRAEGTVDLSLLVAGDPAWSVAGTLTINGNINGTTQDPDLSGTAHVTNGSVEHADSFSTLTALNGDAVFSGNRMSVRNLEGRIGGGTLRLQGSGILRDRQIEAMNFRIEADDVRFRYPEGLRTVLDGTLVLSGNWEAPLLAGNLQIQNLSYRSEFEEFLALFQPGGLSTTNSELERIQLALNVSGTRNIIIKNELADVEASATLDIKGTAGNPSVTGYIETTGGTLMFQDNQYEITRGNIAFVDPLRIDPEIDIQAETEVREYRVILRIVGRGNNVSVDLRSDPPLPQLELIGLIAGGKTTDEFEDEQRAFGTQGDLPTSEELFKLGAASILLGQVQAKGRFGLLGLDRIRIDPYLSGAGSNTRARITVTEQVTKDLSVTYSQDVVSNQQRVILIEYFLNKNLSIVASREEIRDTPALGLDIRLRTRF